jgi:3D (Asp-Asp-Asp) domain-containing protein
MDNLALMTEYTLRKLIPTQNLKKVVAIALLVAVSLSTIPVKSALADVNASTTTISGADAMAFIVSAAREMSKAQPISKEAIVKEALVDEPKSELASAPRVTVVRKYATVSMTAYTSRPEETDDTPFITADGSHVRDGIVACNFLPFGTKVRIPALFGDKVFEVHDRMNKRYTYKMDFWMEDLGDARQFGVRHADIEIVKVEDPGTQNDVATLVN